MQKRWICWVLVLCMAVSLLALPAYASESNELTIYTFLRRDLGCSEAVACGILANIYYESDFNPRAYNSGGGYYGLCQWGGERRQRLIGYCDSIGEDYSSVYGQLLYIKYELETNESNVWTILQKIENTADGAYDAGWQWAQYYERCASYHYYERAHRAETVYYPKYHGYALPDPTPHPTPTPTPVHTPTPTATPVPTVAGFDDVPANAYYADAVVWAVNEGITTGKTGSSFAPKDNCTRAEMVTFLWRAMGCPKAEGKNTFSDVKDNAYYTEAVIWAADAGLTTGTTEGKFSPNDVVTRGQTVTFLYRLAGEPEVGADNPFSDIAAGKFYTKGVLWAVQTGVTTGASNSTFEPKSPCTRGQIVTFLYRDMN